MRLYLAGMSGPGSLEDLKELIEPIRPHFDGVIWVLHDARSSHEHSYLVDVGATVIDLPYGRRHDFSRNHYLYCGPLEEGDWVVTADVLERINPTFAANLRPRLIPALEGAGINAAFLYGKHFMFQHHESLRYQGSPHEGLVRDDGQMRAIELSTTFSEEQSRYSVRNAKRDPLHWLHHYARYYLEFPWGSNHCLLGNENRGDPMTIYRKRETTRLQCRAYLRSKGVPRTEVGFKDYILAHPDDLTIKGFCNAEKILNDLWRHYVLKDLTINDNHTWVDMVKL